MNDLASHLKTVHVNKRSEDKKIDSVQKMKIKKKKVQCIPDKVTPYLALFTAYLVKNAISSQSDTVNIVYSDTIIVTIAHRERFLAPKRTFLFLKSSNTVTIGYTLANPHQRH